MLLNSIWKICLLSIYRVAGGKIVWTAHNIEPHFPKYRRLNRGLRRLWAKLPHKIHVHCHYAVTVMAVFLNVDHKKFFVAEHPVYPAKIIPKSNARKALLKIIPELTTTEGKTFYLMIGYIAAYKGIREIIEIFLTLPVNQVLIIAGLVKKNEEPYFQQLQYLKKGKSNIVLYPNYIVDEELSVMLSAVDYVVFNFSVILTSGSVALAQSYQQKIIIPNIGCMQELKGADVIKFNTPQELQQLFTDFLRPEKA